MEGGVARGGEQYREESQGRGAMGGGVARGGEQYREESQGRGRTSRGSVGGGGGEGFRDRVEH